MDIPIPHGRPLTGEFHVPGDKSISHRAIIIASLGEGTSTISGLSTAADPHSTVTCFEALGIRIRETSGDYVVEGRGLRGLRPASGLLDAGNSGTTMRLLAGVLSGQAFGSTLTGDGSLLRRPMRRVTEPLRRMGAQIDSTEAGTAPLVLRPSGRLVGIRYAPPIASAQVKSCVLLAGLYAEGETVVREAVQTRDHTERMLGLHVARTAGGTEAVVNGGMRIEPRHFVVPGDPSGAAFLVAGALLAPRSSIRIANVGLNPGRMAFIHHLRSLGARILIENEAEAAGEPYGDILAESSTLAGHLRLQASDIPDLIDELPVLAVTLLTAGCSMEVHGAGELRTKESDRIDALVGNMRNLGATVEASADGFAFESNIGLVGTEIEPFGDHRIAMAFGVAGLVLPGMRIRQAEHAAVSFPGFWRAIGAAT